MNFYNFRMETSLDCPVFKETLILEPPPLPKKSVPNPIEPITVIQQAKFFPYKEEEKPFEMSDFYKYSTKFKKQNLQNQ